MSRRCRRGGRGRDESGQATFEFLLVFLLLVIILANIIGASIAVFEAEAVTNGARSGARAGIAEAQPLVHPGTGRYGSEYCEPPSAVAIPAGVQIGANVIRVNQVPLCTTDPNGTKLTQSRLDPGFDPGAMAVAVTALPNVAYPTEITVTVTYTAHGIGPFPPIPIPMSYTSTLLVT